jgi:hypothetical protein
LSFYQKDSSEIITFEFNDKTLLYSITLNKKLSNEIKLVASEEININEFKCYIIEMNDIGITQMYFEYNENLYEMSYTKKQDLIEIIKKLKVLK